MPIVERAGAAIMRVYDAGFTVQHKEDNSPLTLADLDSQRVILEGLTANYPRHTDSVRGVGPSSLGRASNLARTLGGRSARRHPRVRQAQWRVHGQYRPGRASTSPYSAWSRRPRKGCCIGVRRGLGAFSHHRGAAADAHPRVRTAEPFARCRQPLARQRPATAAYLARCEAACHDRHRQFAEILPGRRRQADLYPRFGPTSEWDTAAGQALLEAAGGHVTRLDGHRLRYNCRESVINGDFLAFSHPSVLPGAA